MFGAFILYAEKSSATDEQAIRTMFTQLGETWNRHDAKAYSELFSADVNFLTLDGQWVLGRDQLVKSITASFATYGEKGSNSIVAKSLKLIKKNVAVVEAESDLGLTGRARHSPGKVVTRLILVKEKGKWQIAAGESTRQTAG